MATRIAVVGSRTWPRPQCFQITDFVEHVMGQGDTLVSGHGGAVDLTAEQAADALGKTKLIFPAEWDALGKGAGMIRNTHIVENSERTVAFRARGESKGTDDSIRKSRKLRHNTFIVHAPGDSIFDSLGDRVQATVLVNPVNAKGVAGAGLNQQFRERFPFAHDLYREACASGQMGPGEILPIAQERATLIYFATKDHWNNPSELDWIDHGLSKLAEWLSYSSKDLTIAVPALGCGLGRLDWIPVWKLVDQHLGAIRGLTVHLYLPQERHP